MEELKTLGLLIGLASSIFIVHWIWMVIEDFPHNLKHRRKKK